MRWNSKYAAMRSAWSAVLRPASTSASRSARGAWVTFQYSDEWKTWFRIGGSGSALVMNQPTS